MSLLFRKIATCYSTVNHSSLPTDGTVTTVDFVHHWKTVKEKTSSSLSGRHFGHYKAASYSEILSQLHVDSINLTMSWGHPLSRWKSGVTVLLEKEHGNCYIGKLRTICLLEGISTGY
jgi:hypothetical protein